MTVDTMEKTERYIMLFGGIVALVLGILLFTQSTATLAVVMLLVGLTWFIQGIFNLAAIFVDKGQWGWNLFSGVIGVAAGLLVLQNPVASTAVVPAILADRYCRLDCSLPGWRLGCRRVWCGQHHHRIVVDVQLGGEWSGVGLDCGRTVGD